MSDITKCPHGVEALEPRLGTNEGRVFPCWYCVSPAIGQQEIQSSGLRGRIHLASCGLADNHEGGCGPAPPPSTDRKAERIALLERRRLATIEDLRCKTECEDWHGCADCAMDLRDIDNELDGLKF